MVRFRSSFAILASQGFQNGDPLPRERPAPRPYIYVYVIIDILNCEEYRDTLNVYTTLSFIP